MNLASRLAFCQLVEVHTKPSIQTHCWGHHDTISCRPLCSVEENLLRPKFMDIDAMYVHKVSLVKKFECKCLSRFC